MSGIQDTVAIALHDLRIQVLDGKFGEGDDFDAIAFDDALDEITSVAQ